MPPSMYVKNEKEVLAAFKKLDKLSQASTLRNAVTAGLQPIKNRVVELAPFLTGTYRRAVNTEIAVERDGYCEGVVGTNQPQARRLEFGFNDTDSLGRTYHQPPKPHFRPAFDEKKADAVDEMRDTLHDVLMALL